jgi:heat shock protein HtpX
MVRRRLAPLDEAERRRHKMRNVGHSILLLGGIVVLLPLCGWVLFGVEGLIGMALGAGLAFAFSPRPRRSWGCACTAPARSGAAIGPRSCEC